MTGPEYELWKQALGMSNYAKTHGVSDERLGDMLRAAIGPEVRLSPVEREKLAEFTRLRKEQLRLLSEPDS